MPLRFRMPESSFEIKKEKQYIIILQGKKIDKIYKN